MQTAGSSNIYIFILWIICMCYTIDAINVCVYIPRFECILYYNADRSFLQSNRFYWKYSLTNSSRSKRSELLCTFIFSFSVNIASFMLFFRGETSETKSNPWEMCWVSPLTEKVIASFFIHLHHTVCQPGGGFAFTRTS